MSKALDNIGSSLLSASDSLAISDQVAGIATTLADRFNDYDNEVICRPAGQQWPVCTP